MPSVRVTNLTPVVLNISLKQVAALHFKNEVEPGETIKLRPGKVHFTLEAVVDDGTNRYSKKKSAATIGIISIAVASLTITQSASFISELALLPSSISTAISTISDQTVPRAITHLSNSLGGLTNVQEEVLSILSSPLTPSNLRVQGIVMLYQLRKAKEEDRVKKKKALDERERRIETFERERLQELEKEARIIQVQDSSAKKSGGVGRRDGDLEQNGPGGLAVASRDQAVLVARYRVVEATGFTGPKVVRKHGLYIGERRHFEIRLLHPDLAIYDTNNNSYI